MLRKPNFGVRREIQDGRHISELERRTAKRGRRPKHYRGREQIALPDSVNSLAEKVVRRQFTVKRGKRRKILRVQLVPNGRY